MEITKDYLGTYKNIVGKRPYLADWICLRLPSCSPWFESQENPLAIFPEFD